MNLPELRPRLPFLGVACAAVLGIAVADRWAADSTALLALALVSGVTVLVWPRTWMSWIFTMLAFAALHTLRQSESPGRVVAQALADGPRVMRATGGVWSEPEPLPYWSREQSGRFRLKVERLECEDRTFACELLMNVTWAGPMPAYGDRVALTGSARKLEPVRTPGQFDFSAYLRRQGVWCHIDARFASDCAIESHGHGGSMALFAIRSRHWLEAQLVRDLGDSPEIATLISSMVLGLRGSDAPEAMQEMFRRTGTLHLFAVSGLNIAMLAWLACFLLKVLGVPRRMALCLVIPLLGGYALVSGLSASCVRAAIMASLVLLGQFFERRAAVYNSLAASAVVILAFDTNQLFSPGFQFSFTLVFVIVFLANRIQRRCERIAMPDPFLPKPLWSWCQRAIAGGGALLAGSLGVTISAWLGSLLFTAGYFHLFSPSAILANMCAVPLAFCILVLGFASAFTAIFAKSIALLFNNANWFCAKSLLVIVGAFAELPGGYYYVELPKAGAPPDWEFTVLEVGAGAAIHLHGQQSEWLIDGGSTMRYGHTTLPYLRTRGVNRLDALLLTHGDAQHIGSAAAVLEDFTPRRIFDSPLKDRSPVRRDFHATLAKQGFGEAFCQRGDVLAFAANATLRVLYPPAGLRRTVTDDKAVVLLLEAGGVRALFMSDSGFLTEQWLLENEPDLRADLLIKGWHTKDLSGTPNFLGRVAPQVVICSPLGYGEPSEKINEWSREIAAHGITVFRQDQCGAVTVQIRGHEFTAHGFVNDQTFRSRAR
jgi:ComEC/Rec2-related protein